MPAVMQAGKPVVTPASPPAAVPLRKGEAVRLEVPAGQPCRGTRQWPAALPAPLCRPERAQHPVPRSTTDTVRSMMARSPFNDSVCAYSVSNLPRSLNGELFRSLTCQGPVMPGRNRK